MPYIFYPKRAIGFNRTIRINWGNIMTFLLELFVALMVFPVFAQQTGGWVNPTASGHITPDDFPAYTSGSTKKARIQEYIGHKNYYNRLRYFYTNLNDVYSDFNISPTDIMDCDSRHQQALQSKQSTWMMTNARNYFCLGEFNTAYCHQNQYITIQH